MLGAIIGDIIGSRYEFHNTDNYNFELFGSGTSFTDDTICTIAIADAINTSKGKAPRYKDMLVSWCKSFPNPQGGYGGSFNRWIWSQDHEPYNSFGNGSAMRVAPVAWAYDDLNKVLAEAKRTASVTHNHPEGIKGAQAIAHAIYLLRTTRDLEVLHSLSMHYYPSMWVDVFTPGVFNETCQGTVPVAFKIILASTSFEDAIRRAICWGGDSDTIGAIVGSMAEAAFGIPEEIYHKAFTYITPEMDRVIASFFNKLNNKHHG